MDILVSSDKNYLKYLKVLMASVYVNHDKNMQINFYVLHNSLTDDDQLNVSSFAAKYHQKVYFLYVDENKYTNVLCHFKYARYATSTLFPLFAHEVLPEKMQRILYLDIDVAVNGDLTELYQLDFDDCYLIASKPQYNVKDEPQNEFEEFDRVKKYNISNAKAGDYFNAGVLMMNLAKFRQSNINAQYYAEKLRGLENIFFDQGILNICFAQETKILKTCAYNYRLHYSAKDYFKRENDRMHGQRNYTFYPFEPKIIHYCGLLPGGNTKPWTYYFEKGGDIGDPRKEFFDMIPECVPYFKIWWDHASLTPDYEELRLTARINTAAYQMVKKITLEKRQEFCNQLGLESYYVPAGTRERNSILQGDDLNCFTRPKVYRCANAQIKETVINLPRDYTQKCGFRLTVKHIHSNAKEDSNTSTIQILELNHPDAIVYRRYCGSPQKGTWGKWHRMLATSEVNIAGYHTTEIDQLNKENQKLKKDLEKIKNSTSWRITAPFRKIMKNIRKLIIFLK